MQAEIFNVKGNRRFKTTVVYVTDYTADGDGMVLLNLVGPSAPVRAMWANIVKGRKARSPVRTDVQVTDEHAYTQTIRVTPGIHYHSHTTIVDEARINLLILREEFSRATHKYIFGGGDDEPSPWFEAALQRVPSLPYKKEWLPILWKAALHANYIDLLSEGHTNIAVWRIRDGAGWDKLLLRLLKNGEIK